MADDVKVSVRVDTGDSVREVGELRDEVRDAGGELDKLDARSVEADVRVDVDEASARRAGEALEDVGRKAKGLEDGVGFGTNALRDLTGPFGDAIGNAGDLGEAFEGMGDIVSGALERVGVSAGTAGKVAGVLGGLGVAVAIAAAAWNIYRQRQEKAAEISRDMLKVQEALADGKYAEAAGSLAESYSGTVAALKELGFNTQDFVNTLEGQGSVIDQLKGRYAELRTELETAIQDEDDERAQRLSREYELVGGLIDNLPVYRDAWLEAGSSVATNATVTGELETALRDVEAAGNDAAGSVRTIGEAFDELMGKLDQSSAIEGVRDAFDAVEDAGVNAMQAAAEQLPTADRAMRDYEQSIRDAIGQVIELDAELGGIVPPEQLKSIAVALAEGDLATARQLLEQVAAKLPPLTIELDTEYLSAQYRNWARTSGPGSLGGGVSSPPNLPTTTNVTVFTSPKPSAIDVALATASWARTQGRP